MCWYFHQRDRPRPEADVPDVQINHNADGARYEVRPDHLTIYSKGRVDSAEPALEYSPG